MEETDEFSKINHHKYGYYDEYNYDKGKRLTIKKNNTTVADNIKFNMNEEDKQCEYERKQRKIEEDKNYEKNKKKLEYFHIKNEDPMYNMLEDKKAEFEQSKEIIKEYLQALLDEYHYKQYKRKKKHYSSKSRSKDKKQNKKVKVDRFPKSKYESSSESDSDSDSSSSSSSD